MATTRIAGADLVMLTAGVNEKGGGATNRNDPKGRLKLLDTNVGVYKDMVPKVVAAAPDAVLLVVTDPPDPLAYLARGLAGHDRVLSTGTLLDSLRFRAHLAQRLGVNPRSVEAQVVGEHGTSEVFLWSSARVSGVPVAEALPRGTRWTTSARTSSAMSATPTSRSSKATTRASSASASCRPESPRRCCATSGGTAGRHVQRRLRRHLSLPSVVGREGVSRVLKPAMSDEERRSLQASAEVLRQAVQRIS